MSHLLFSALAVAAAAALAAPAAPAKDSISGFRTPSGNIGCQYVSSSGKAYLRCDIRSGLNPRPKKPKSCDVDYGGGLAMVKTGRASIVCAGDTVLDPKAPVLKYGKTWKRDGFQCISYTNGLTCTNASSHGWFLSRQKYVLS